jgi:hypothetical protein
MHPLGFAYFPDGAHDDKNELEPGIVPPGSSSTCDTDFTCPAPMYFLGDEYLGSYTNIDAVERSSDYDAENFGLDDYEPKFFHPITEWIGYGDFSVYLKFDVDTDYDKDIFYFCHVSKLCDDPNVLERNSLCFLLFTAWMDNTSQYCRFINTCLEESSSSRMAPQSRKRTHLSWDMNTTPQGVMTSIAVHMD